VENPFKIIAVPLFTVLIIFIFFLISLDSVPKLAGSAARRRFVVVQVSINDSDHAVTKLLVLSDCCALANGVDQKANKRFTFWDLTGNQICLPGKTNLNILI
jgi:hypothetical protein